MAKVNPGEFVRQVRQETSKVTWPSRKEVQITSVMVVIMVILTGLFFMGIDGILSFVVRQILGLGA